MSIGSFTDKNHQPTEDEVLHKIGTGVSFWQEIIRFIREHYPVAEDFKFLYGKKYGWALRFRIKGKLFASLYPAAGGFTIQIILSSTAVEQALQMGMGKNVHDVISRATPYPEGKWLFIPVRSLDDIKDIRRLLALKTAPKPAQERKT